MSDSSGFIYDKNGITEEKLAWVKSIKKRATRALSRNMARKFSREICGWPSGPGGSNAIVRFPALPRTKLPGEDARKLIEKRLLSGFRGGQHADRSRGRPIFSLDKKILFGPGKRRRMQAVVATFRVWK